MSVDSDKIEIPLPTPHETHNVIERPNEAIPHVVLHENRITHLEEQQAQHFQDLVGQIDATRQELFQALENAKSEQASHLESKLNTLTEKLDQLTAPVVEVPPKVADDLAEIPEEAAVTVIPEVEHTIEPATPKGLRARRKAKHGKQ